MAKILCRRVWAAIFIRYTSALRFCFVLCLCCFFALLLERQFFVPASNNILDFMNTSEMGTQANDKHGIRIFGCNMPKQFDSIANLINFS